MSICCECVTGFVDCYSYPVGGILFTVEFRIKKPPPSREAIFLKRISKYLSNQSTQTKQFNKLFPKSSMKAAQEEADKYKDRDVALMDNGGISIDSHLTPSASLLEKRIRGTLRDYRSVAQSQLNLFALYLW